jgi:hypothetical protein
MSYNLIKRLFICFLIGFFIFSFNSNVFAGGSISIQWGKGSDSEREALLHMLLLMGIGLNTSTAISHPVQSIMILAGDSIFTSKVITGK